MLSIFLIIFERYELLDNKIEMDKTLYLDKSIIHHYFYDYMILR